MIRPIASMKVDPSFLVAALNLPNETEILDIRFVRYWAGFTVELIISHPDIPKGEHVEVEPTFRHVVDVTHFEGRPLTATEFLGWNPKVQG